MIIYRFHPSCFHFYCSVKFLRLSPCGEHSKAQKASKMYSVWVSLSAVNYRLLKHILTITVVNSGKKYLLE